MAVLGWMNTVQYSYRSGLLYATCVSLGPPESSTQTASRSLLQVSLGHRPTDKLTVHATRSVTIGGIYVLRCGLMICGIQGRIMSNISTVYLNNTLIYRLNSYLRLAFVRASSDHSPLRSFTLRFAVWNLSNPRQSILVVCYYSSKVLIMCILTYIQDIDGLSVYVVCNFIFNFIHHFW